MKLVNITIRNHPYQIACDPGQEDNLKLFAEDINKKVAELSKTFPKASDNTLLVMTSLMLKDELEEEKKLNQYFKKEIKEQVEFVKDAKSSDDEALIDTINAIAEYVESIAKKLEII